MRWCRPSELLRPQSHFASPLLLTPTGPQGRLIAAQTIVWSPRLYHPQVDSIEPPRIGTAAACLSWMALFQMRRIWRLPYIAAYLDES